MKIVLLTIGILCFATLASAGTFLEARQNRWGEAHLTPEELVSNLKASEFGRNILNLMTLQFKTSGALDDALGLIQDLKAKLSAQQNGDDSQYADKTQANNNIISEQTGIIDTATATIATYTQQVTDAQVQFSQLQVTQAQLQGERDGLVSALDAATVLRAADAVAYTERTKKAQLLIQGLQKALTVFGQQTAKNDKYKQDDVNNINNLLNNLVTAYQASIAQDSQMEDQAIQDFNDYEANVNNRITEINDQLDSIALELSNLQSLIDQLNQAIATQITVRDNAQALKDRTIQAQADMDQRYKRNKDIRAEQIELLQSAIIVLSNNSQDVQNYLNNAQPATP